MKKKLALSVLIILLVGVVLSVINHGGIQGILGSVKSGTPVLALLFTFLTGLCFYQASWNIWVNLFALVLCTVLLFGFARNLQNQDLATWKVATNLVIQAISFVCGFIWEQLPWKEEVDETEGLL